MARAASPRTRVLVVDDDPALLRALRLGLGSAGHEVLTASSGEDGVAMVVDTPPDVIVLDLGLPDVDGLTVCRRIRGWSQVPIIVLSARGSEAGKVAALDGGADDYVTKPFGMAELEARIRTALRHRRPDGNHTEPTSVTVGPLVVDRARHQASLDGAALDLTAKEFEVLAFLAAHAGNVCTHQMILRAVWGTEYAGEAQYLHAYVHRLRQKLGAGSTVVIRTAPGIGYRLALDGKGSLPDPDPARGPSPGAP